MTLPKRPDIAWLRGAARGLLKALRSGDNTSNHRLNTCLPDLAATKPTLAQAQTVIAREHGLASWPALKAEVEARRVRQQATPPSPRRIKADAVLASLIADAAAGDPKVLADRPGVGRGIIESVRDMLEARPADRALVLATYLKGLAHDNPRVRFECAHALDGDACAVLRRLQGRAVGQRRRSTPQDYRARPD